MSMKMRVLTATKKGKLIALANVVAKKADSYKAVDVIPPAYSCERERLVVIVVTAKAVMESSFNIFVADLSRDRTQNVAFIVDGTPENAAKILESAKNAGTHVHENVLYLNGGLPFKFLKKYTDEEKAKVEAWTEEVLASLA